MQIVTLPSRLAPLPEVDCAAVIDVLRATTTIAAALAAGARAVHPVLSLAAARRLAGQQPGTLLAGERGGRKPRGFDLGNSPLEFVPARVCGRLIVTTTTNGTRALRLASSKAKHVVTLSLTNRRAVVDWLASQNFASLALVCSGDEGLCCGEDLLGAGALLAAWGNGKGHALDDLSRIALAWFTSQEHNLLEAVAATSHGRFLAEAGFGQDVQACSALDSLSVVPLLQQGTLKASHENT